MRSTKNINPNKRNIGVNKIYQLPKKLENLKKNWLPLKK